MIIFVEKNRMDTLGFIVYIMREESRMAKTVIFAGHAKFPQGMAANKLFDALAVTAEVDLKYGVIIRFTSTLASLNTQRYIENIMVGHSLLDGLDPVLEEIRKGYHGKAQQAIIAAIKDLYSQFMNYYENAKK